MRKSLVIFTIINAICLLFVVLADLSTINLASMEGRTVYDGVDSISFLCVAGPFFLACFLFNVCWAVMVIWKAFRRDFTPLLAMAIAIVAWGGAFEMTRWISIRTIEKTKTATPVD